MATADGLPSPTAAGQRARGTRGAAHEEAGQRARASPTRRGSIPRPFERSPWTRPISAPSSDGSATISAQQLRNFVDRIERLEQDKAGIADDIKDCYAEAKSLGYEVKILRKVIALRKKKPNERREEEELLEIYLQALGDLV